MNPEPRGRVAGSVLALLLLSCASSPPAVDETAALRVAQIYYEALAGERSLASIPMAADLSFRGPGRSASSANAFRAALEGLTPRVADLRLRYQLVDGDSVLSFYDLDLGAPSGPIPTAERLRVVGDELVEVELLFDSRRLAAGGAAQER